MDCSSRSGKPASSADGATDEKMSQDTEKREPAGFAAQEVLQQREQFALLDHHHRRRQQQLTQPTAPQIRTPRQPGGPTATATATATPPTQPPISEHRSSPPSDQQRSTLCEARDGSSPTSAAPTPDASSSNGRSSTGHDVSPHTGDKRDAGGTPDSISDRSNLSSVTVNSGCAQDLVGAVGSGARASGSNKTPAKRAKTLANEGVGRAVVRNCTPEWYKSKNRALAQARNTVGNQGAFLGGIATRRDDVSAGSQKSRSTSAASFVPFF